MRRHGRGQLRLQFFRREAALDCRGGLRTDQFRLAEHLDQRVKGLQKLHGARKGIRTDQRRMLNGTTPRGTSALLRIWTAYHDDKIAQLLTYSRSNFTALH
jgi:hypothetical protein